MENKINIAELLKDCPKGMELDCTICNNVVTLEDVDTAYSYPIEVVSKSGFHHTLTCEGYVYAEKDAKCVIFPKGKNTWEGFVPPHEFKDGDIVATNLDSQVFILQKAESDTKGYCYIGYDFKSNEFFDAGVWEFERLATEEEKQELFKVIKENGYKWNEETKNLEKVSQYPQTFEECCTVLGLTELGIIGGYRHGLLTQFRNLLICRDAYWKIADDWKFNFEEKCYYLCNEYHEIQDFNGVCDCNAVLAFPTEEMREAFYDNFEELIKECKSLL